LREKKSSGSGPFPLELECASFEILAGATFAPAAPHRRSISTDRGEGILLPPRENSKKSARFWKKN